MPGLERVWRSLSRRWVEVAQGPGTGRAQGAGGARDWGPAVRPCAPAVRPSGQPRAVALSAEGVAVQVGGGGTGC